jgi:uncharacterized protein YhaN
MRDTAYHAMQTREKLSNDLNRDPTIEEIAKEMGRKKSDIVIALESIVDPVSFYEPVYSNGGDTIYLMDQLGTNESDGDWIDEISMKEAEAQRRFHSERLQILRERDGDLKTELINLKAKCEDPDALGDELAARKSEYAEAEKIYEAVLTAMEGIETAASVMRGSITPSIGRNAAELIRGMTDGRYKDVNMDRTLELELVDGNGLTTTSDMMSGGMKDAAYLALRIALMGNIFGDEKPPLMMDEALCQLDEGRTKTALRMLSRLGDEGVQILLFTCHGRERKICEKEGIGAKITQMSRICG